MLNITMMKELQNKSYEELVQLQQDGKITLVEFVEAQPELTDAWKEWIDMISPYYFKVFVVI